jgi:hypothetical protein
MAAEDAELAAGGIVVATPLSAVRSTLPELTPLFDRRGSGVLLGSDAPDGSDSRLDELARPVLEELGFRVTALPLTDSLDDPEVAVLQSADVVVADMTEQPFGVLEKLIVARRSGVPDVAVTFDPAGDRPAIVHFPFDIMRLEGVSLEDSRRSLRAQLEGLRGLVERFGDDVVANDELTSFFRAPLTRVSAAYGLAVGYFTNFVDVVCTALSLLGQERRVTPDSRASVVMRRTARRRTAEGPALVEEDWALTPAKAREAVLDVVMPGKLEWATERNILHACTARGLWRARVVDRENSRNRTLWATVDHGRVHLVDPFPTTMNAMRESIDNLLGTHDYERVSPRWKAAESKEIRRFYSSLVHLVHKGDPVRYRQVRIVGWTDLFEAGQVPPD